MVTIYMYVSMVTIYTYVSMVTIHICTVPIRGGIIRQWMKVLQWYYNCRGVTLPQVAGRQIDLLASALAHFLESVALSTVQENYGMLHMTSWVTRFGCHSAGSGGGVACNLVYIPLQHIPLLMPTGVHNCDVNQSSQFLPPVIPHIL